MPRQKEPSSANQPPIFAKTYALHRSLRKHTLIRQTCSGLTRLLDLALIGTGLLGLAFCSHLMFRHGVTWVYGLGLLASLLPIARTGLTVSQKSNVMLIVMGDTGASLWHRGCGLIPLTLDDLDRTGEGYVASGWMRLNATDKLVRQLALLAERRDIPFDSRKKNRCSSRPSVKRHRGLSVYSGSTVIPNNDRGFLEPVLSVGGLPLILSAESPQANRTVQ